MLVKATFHSAIGIWLEVLIALAFFVPHLAFHHGKPHMSPRAPHMDSRLPGSFVSCRILRLRGGFRAKWHTRHMSGMTSSQLKVSKAKQEEMEEEEFNKLVEHKMRILKEEAMAEQLELLGESPRFVGNLGNLSVDSLRSRRGMKRTRSEVQGEDDVGGGGDIAKGDEDGDDDAGDEEDGDDDANDGNNDGGDDDNFMVQAADVDIGDLCDSSDEEDADDSADTEGSLAPETHEDKKQRTATHVTSNGTERCV
jgi:hypothetical protein